MSRRHKGRRRAAIATKPAAPKSEQEQLCDFVRSQLTVLCAAVQQQMQNADGAVAAAEAAAAGIAKHSAALTEAIEARATAAQQRADGAARTEAAERAATAAAAVHIAAAAAAAAVRDTTAAAAAAVHIAAAAAADRAKVGKDGTGSADEGTPELQPQSPEAIHVAGSPLRSSRARRRWAARARRRRERAAATLAEGLGSGVAGPQTAHERERERGESHAAADAEPAEHHYDPHAWREPEEAVPVAALSAGVALSLFLRCEHSGTVPVDLAVDATLWDLRMGAYRAFGVAPHEQVLTVGAEEVDGDDDTALSDVPQMANEQTVEIRRRAVLQICASEQYGMVLAAGSLRCYGARAEMPAFSGPVTSIHTGDAVCAAVAGGRLHVWGAKADGYERDVRRLYEALERDEATLVSCALSAYLGVLGVVDSHGRLHLLGPSKGVFTVPERFQGRITDVACGGHHVVARTRDSVLEIGFRSQHERTFSGLDVVSISAGADHYSVVFHDGSVQCFGASEKGQCEVPADLHSVVSCVCGGRNSLALRRDGCVVGWGVSNESMGESDTRYAAVVAGPTFRAAVTEAGKLVFRASKRGFPLEWFRESRRVS